MIFKKHQLTNELKSFVESIFHFSSFTPEHSIERVVPTGHLFLLFELDNIPRHTYHNKTLASKNVFTKAWVSGIHKNYLSISAPQNSEMFVIQFKPTGAYPFIQKSIEELNDKVTKAEYIFGNSVLHLREDFINTDTSEEKFKLAEEWLLKIIDTNKSPSNELLKIFETIAKQPTNQYTSAINSYSKTQKHLISQFKKYFGLKPKDFQRIFRFNKILEQIHQKERINWSQIAYESGYTDQSHFIKEFKMFSGFNPQEFIINDFNQDEPNFFPLDRKG